MHLWACNGPLNVISKKADKLVVMEGTKGNLSMQVTMRRLYLIDIYLTDKHASEIFLDVQEMLSLAIKYNKAVQEEDELPPEKLAIANVGRQDAKKHLEEHVSNLMSSNIVQTLGTMLDTVVF